MTAAPACFASSGIISGSGFDIAKIIGCGAICLTASCLRMPGPLNPMNTSASRNTSASEPCVLFGFVILDNSSLWGFMFSVLPS